mmetsp:Transcript_15178/g.39023  ORF Transcript_15178/g.39023 Transcript_15178/m.39023 type:complete len:210 (+) Transcript_15178:4297-4926(+)
MLGLKSTVLYSQRLVLLDTVVEAATGSRALRSDGQKDRATCRRTAVERRVLPCQRQRRLWRNRLHRPSLVCRRLIWIASTWSRSRVRHSQIPRVMQGRCDTSKGNHPHCRVGPHGMSLLPTTSRSPTRKLSLRPRTHRGTRTPSQCTSPSLRQGWVNPPFMEVRWPTFQMGQVPTAASGRLWSTSFSSHLPGQRARRQARNHAASLRQF